MGILNKLFKRKSKSVVGIDIGTSNIKVVQIRKDKGKLILESYGSLSLGPSVNKELGRAVVPTLDAMTSSLNTLLREANITASTAGVAIPSRASFMSIIEVPAVSDKKIAQIVPFEARKYIPVPIEEVSLDWNIIPNVVFKGEGVDAFGERSQDSKPTEPQKRRVIFSATHNNELKKYRDILRGTSMNVKIFESEVSSTLRAVTTINKTPILVTDMGAGTTKFYIINHGIILRSYVINQGGETITRVIASAENIKFEAAEKMKIDLGLGITDEAAVKSIKNVLKEILAEANHVISDFESKYKQSVSKVVFTGGGSTLSGLMSFAAQCVNTPVELADPFSRLQHPLFLSETLRSTGAEFTVAIGISLALV